MSTAAKQVVKIDIVSDTVCPWCFIGKRRLEKAITQYKTTNPDIEFDVNWHPFELDPTAPKNGIPKRERYIQKFGPQRANQIIPYMKSTGLEEGIKFSYEGLTANTINSHRLIEWAKKQGKQDEIVEELFKFYFEQDRNIGDIEELAGAAGRIGLDKEKALEYLKSGEGEKEVKEAIFQAQAQEIHGVHNFTIQDTYSLSGAQPPETFL